MKSKLLSTTLLLNIGAYALPVDTTSLKQISIGFLGQTLQIKADAATLDSLSSAPPISIPAIERAVQIAPNLYTVYFVGGGFVTLSMDDLARPILAYSLNGSMPDSSFNEAYDSLIHSYSISIDSAKARGISDPMITSMWDDLQRFISGNSVSSTAFSDSTVFNTGLVFANGDIGPLLHTNWNQGAGWNMYAPSATGGPGGKAYAGCVATAMGQIMKYWAFPSSGTSSRNNINFALTQYAWDSMPNETYSSATATLLRHAGASVDMNYGAGGSGAYSYKSAIAYKDYFRYKPTASYVQKATMTQQKWLDTLKKEIDQGRPVQYEGFGTGGHAFVMDGYNSSDYFHFNFGWSGTGNGWYALTAVTPGNMNFTNNQGAIIGIQPGNYTRSPGQSISGLRSNGQAYASGDLASLSKLEDGASYSTFNSGIAKFAIMELDGDGNMDDIIGLSSRGILMYNRNFGSNNSWSSLPGAYKSFISFDQNQSGHADAIAAINTTGYITTKSAQGIFRTTTTKAIALFSADLAGTGFNSTLINMDAGYNLYSSQDSGSTWNKISTSPVSPRTVIPYDGDGNGSREYLALIDANRQLWSNASGGWAKVGTGIASMIPVDLKQDGSADDFLALSSTGIITLSKDGGISWTSSPSSGYKQLLLADADRDGTKDDIIAINSNYTITVFIDADFNKTFKAPISAVQIDMADLDGDGARESLVTRASNGSFNVTNQLSQVWLANALDLEVGSFDDVGTLNDLMGIAYDGTLFRSLNGHDWTRIFPPVPAVDLAVGDFNQDGTAGEIVMAGSNGKIYYSMDANSWDSLSTPGFFKVGVGDFDADGFNDDLVAISKTLNVFVSKDLDTLILSGASQKSAFAIDLDGDGKRDDLAGISSNGQVRTSTDLKTWTAIPGTYNFANAGDFDGDGKFDDIVALNSSGVANYTTNLSTWNVANGKNFKSVVSSDLDGEGLLNDLIALDASGNLWYSKDRYTWNQIPGMFKFYAVGNFSSLLDVNGILQSQQTLASLDSASEASTTRTAPQVTGLQAHWHNNNLEIAGLSEGKALIVLYNGQGQTLFQGNIISKNNTAYLSANLKGQIFGMVMDSQLKYHQFQIQIP